MDWLLIERECKYRTSRSSGSGGQHINKVETKVEILFDLEKSAGLSAEEKSILRRKLAKRLSSEGLLSATAQESRSQASNRDKAAQKLQKLLLKALEPEPEREPVPEKLVANAGSRKRAKSAQSVKKSLRKKVDLLPDEE